MKREDVIDFLNFRKKFSKLEWFEINKTVADRENEKADKLVLDDFDIGVILERIVNNPFMRLDDYQKIGERILKESNT